VRAQPLTRRTARVAGREREVAVMGGGVRPKRAIPESCQLAHKITSARHASGSHAKALHLRSCSVPTHRHGICDTHRMVSLVEHHNLCLRGSSSRGLVRPSNAIVRTPSAWRFKGDCRRTISGWSAHALSSIIVCSSVRASVDWSRDSSHVSCVVSGRASPVLQPPLMRAIWRDSHLPLAM
jgi:hypothetical protein